MDQKKSTALVLQPFITSGLSACTASACIHPIDLAKVRLQLYAVQHPGTTPPNFVSLLATMVKRSGFTSIYAGLSASLTRQCTYGTARMGECLRVKSAYPRFEIKALIHPTFTGIHRTISDILQERNGGAPISFVAKSAAGIVVCHHWVLMLS